MSQTVNPTGAITTTPVRKLFLRPENIDFLAGGA
jgi:hypothetical protein